MCDDSFLKILKTISTLLLFYGLSIHCENIHHVKIYLNPSYKKFEKRTMLA